MCRTFGAAGPGTDVRHTAVSVAARWADGHVCRRQRLRHVHLRTAPRRAVQAPGRGHGLLGRRKCAGHGPQVLASQSWLRAPRLPLIPVQRAGQPDSLPGHCHRGQPTAGTGRRAGFRRRAGHRRTIRPMERTAVQAVP